MPDPKLKAAAEEIKAVLRKYDICAHIALGSASHTEFVREFCATWTCMTMDGPNGFRVKSRLADYGGDKAAKKKVLEESIGVLMGFANQAERDCKTLNCLLMEIAKTIPFDHIEKEEE